MRIYSLSHLHQTPLSPYQCISKVTQQEYSLVGVKDISLVPVLMNKLYMIHIPN